MRRRIQSELHPPLSLREPVVTMCIGCWSSLHRVGTRQERPCFLQRAPSQGWGTAMLTARSFLWPQEPRSPGPRRPVCRCGKWPCRCRDPLQGRARGPGDCPQDPLCSAHSSPSGSSDEHTEPSLPPGPTPTSSATLLSVTAGHQEHPRPQTGLSHTQTAQESVQSAT